MTIGESIIRLANEVSRMGGKPEAVAMSEDAFEKLSQELGPRVAMHADADEYTVTRFHGMLVFRRADAPPGSIYVGSEEDLG